MAIQESTGTVGRLIGYARVSTNEQETALQLAAMRLAGIELIFEEKRSSVVHRPVLAQALAALRPGDTLCVYKVDRLARSLIDLMTLLRDLEKRGVAFRSLTEPIETATPAGRLMLQILGAFAEFERNVIRERCAAGRCEAKARGVRFGRPRSFDRAEAVRLRASGLSWVAVGQRLGCSATTVRCALRGAV